MNVEEMNRRTDEPRMLAGQADEGRREQPGK
jgi:hypothetical protein